MDQAEKNAFSRSPALAFAIVAGGGFAAGAMLSYLLDPKQGARRRAEIRQRTGRFARASVHAAEGKALDVAHRAEGMVAKSRGRLQAARARMRGDGEDDTVIAQRVRTKLGRLSSHPSSILVSSRDGVVQLAGPVLEAEADRVVRGALRVRGVREVVDRLRRHVLPGRVPGLQGGARGGR